MKPTDMPWPPQWRREQMPELAALWMAALRENAPPHEDDVGVTITLMNFTASPDVQWAFLAAAIAAAESEDEYCAIAAGPFMARPLSTLSSAVARRIRNGGERPGAHGNI